MYTTNTIKSFYIRKYSYEHNKRNVVGSDFEGTIFTHIAYLYSGNNYYSPTDTTGEHVNAEYDAILKTTHVQKEWTF